MHTWGVGASDAMLKRVYLDFGENHETGRIDPTRRKEERIVMQEANRS
jgi:hypothetical protein